MLQVGIDPGLSGALAVLDAAGEVITVADLPIIRDRSLAWVDGAELQSLLLAATEGRQRGIARCNRTAVNRGESVGDKAQA